MLAVLRSERSAEPALHFAAIVAGALVTAAVVVASIGFTGGPHHEVSQIPFAFVI